MRRHVVLWVLAATLALGARSPEPREGPEIRQHEAEGLRYLEVVTAGGDPSAKLPMVVYLHGRADRPHPPDSDSWYGIERPVRLIMPAAPDRLEDGYTWLPHSVTAGRTEELTKALVERSDQLSRFLEEVRSRHPTVGRPIVTGFSQGGILTFGVSTRHPAAVGEAYPLAGWLPPGAMPTERVWSIDHPPTIRAMHGTEDPIVRLAPTLRSVEGLKRLGWDVELHEYEGVGHEMSDAMQHRYGQWLREAVERAALKRQRPSSVASPGV